MFLLPLPTLGAGYLVKFDHSARLSAHHNLPCGNAGNQHIIVHPLGTPATAMRPPRCIRFDRNLHAA